MGTLHVVKAGDHAPKIAAQYGFGDFQTVWRHPDNADLAGARHPCVLLPGDQLAIPDRKTKDVSCPTEAKHKFTVRRAKITLRVVLLDATGQPVANAPATLSVGGRDLALTSDGDGKIEQDIPVDTESCTLSCADQEMTLQIGHLDPVDQPSGVRARLANLGYPAGTEDEDPDGMLLRSAIEELQCDNGMDLTGEADDATQAKLLSLHGS